jgi:hypothetical protein
LILYPQKEEDINPGPDCTGKVLAYQGKIAEIFGWGSTAYLVMKLAHTLQAITEHDDHYTILDSHCERVTFHSDSEDEDPEDYHFLELNLEEIENSVILTQFHPDFRYAGDYFANMYDKLHVGDMGVERWSDPIQNSDGSEEDADDESELSDELSFSSRSQED